MSDLNQFRLEVPSEVPQLSRESARILLDILLSARSDERVMSARNAKVAFEVGDEEAVER